MYASCQVETRETQEGKRGWIGNLPIDGEYCTKECEVFLASLIASYSTRVGKIPMRIP